MILDNLGAKYLPRNVDVLATSGVHIGGTDFDQRLNLERVMPEFGFRHKDARGREVPSKVFFELSSWHLINWLYAAKAVRQAKELRSSYADTRLHDRLMRVLEERHGHRIASAVEEQTATTNEMSRNVSDAASAAKDIASNVGSASDSASQARNAGTNTAQAAGELAQRAAELQTLVGHFRY